MSSPVVKFIQYNFYLQNSSNFIPLLNNLENKVSSLTARVYNALKKITVDELNNEVHKINHEDLKSIEFFYSDIKKIANNNQIQSEIKLEIKKLNKKISELESSIKERESKFDITSSVMHRTLLETKIKNLKNKKGKIEQEVEKLKSGLNSLRALSLEKVEARIEKIKNKIAKLNKVKNKIEDLVMDRSYQGKVESHKDLYIHTFHGEVCALSTSRWFFRFPSFC